MNRDDILGQYTAYANGYLQFLAEKRKEIQSSMARLQRHAPSDEMPTPKQVFEEMMEERPVWDVIPADMPDEAAVRSEQPASQIGINVPISPADTQKADPDIWEG